MAAHSLHMAAHGVLHMAAHAVSVLRVHKIIFSFTQPHARVSFPSENARWHFEKSNFAIHSTLG
jgi:hypothetical protein|tara:strand:+ start:138 stop:329 length:192 start_codon:yes stop_codon:yes gene_type:complete